MKSPGDILYENLLALDLIQEFEERVIRTVDPTYTDREDRNRFAANWINSDDVIPNGGEVLNIGGGGKRHLGKHLGDKCNVYEIDIVGDCDLLINLDGVSKLPLESNSKDLCCAFDVLEHLENIHSTMEELFRISRSKLLISLPVSSNEIWNNSIFRNDAQKIPDRNRGTHSKFYGLPIQKPNDRHRWWLYFQDIVRFYIWFEWNNPCKVQFAIPKCMGLRNKAKRILLGRYRYYTFCVPHIWILISKE